VSSNPPDFRPPLEVGIHGVPRPREWDAVQTVDGPGAFDGDSLQFVILPDGAAVIEADEPPGSYAGGWETFAAALAGTVDRPFRARAVRAGRGFVVGARRIAVEQLSIEGEELEYTVSAGGRELRIDDWPALRGAEELERIAGDRFSEYVLRGRRLAGASWEIELAPL
jgi:hypothetical protein